MSSVGDQLKVGKTPIYCADVLRCAIVSSAGTWHIGRSTAAARVETVTQIDCVAGSRLVILQIRLTHDTAQNSVPPPVGYTSRYQ